jgi:acetyl esterase
MPELARHYGLVPVQGVLRGIVQHCSAVDFSVVFEKGFIMGLGFVKMLLPRRGRGVDLVPASRFLSPIEWVGSAFPPVLVTTSHADFFYRANLNFIAALRRHRVPVESVVSEQAQHTWQQDSRHPGSVEVYSCLQDFVRRVTATAPVPA